MHTTAFPIEDREVNDSDMDDELDDPNNYENHTENKCNDTR